MKLDIDGNLAAIGPSTESASDAHRLAREPGVFRRDRRAVEFG